MCSSISIYLRTCPRTGSEEKSQCLPSPALANLTSAMRQQIAYQDRMTGNKQCRPPSSHQKRAMGIRQSLGVLNYHASNQNRHPANVTLLPLLVNNAHSPALIKHVMQLIKPAIQHLNPRQVPVLAMDQPLYALAKEIQWSWPVQLDEDSFVLMCCLSRKDLMYVSYISLSKLPRTKCNCCLLYTSPSPRDISGSRMPSSA